MQEERLRDGAKMVNRTKLDRERFEMESCLHSREVQQRNVDLGRWVAVFLLRNQAVQLSERHAVGEFKDLLPCVKK
jgi:hypothetical protein